eukprot:CAMPEP_0174278308 /NCGR_PEP_ID=MMETSP0439-20130205/61405_1 /TAXON_ID=0 /ORGANISM="Stereomyxa ramosa, Strain Chinc5" /LENGTH=335 /DNA_ID=CAMNT_0015370705 /DNA_START=426 /DNA_END=1434 /DNA_ORIENTATION=+
MTNVVNNTNYPNKLVITTQQGTLQAREQSKKSCTNKELQSTKRERKDEGNRARNNSQNSHTQVFPLLSTTPQPNEKKAEQQEELAIKSKKAKRKVVVVRRNRKGRSRKKEKEEREERGKKGEGKEEEGGEKETSKYKHLSPLPPPPPLFSPLLPFSSSSPFSLHRKRTRLPDLSSKLQPRSKIQKVSRERTTKKEQQSRNREKKERRESREEEDLEEIKKLTYCVGRAAMLGSSSFIPLLNLHIFNLANSYLLPSPSSSFLPNKPLLAKPQDVLQNTVGRGKGKEGERREEGEGVCPQDLLPLLFSLLLLFITLPPTALNLLLTKEKGRVEGEED